MRPTHHVLPRPSSLLLALGALLTHVGCAVASDPEEAAPDEPSESPALTLACVTPTWTEADLELGRSLLVVDDEVIGPMDGAFGLRRVLDQLVRQSGVPGLTPLALFRQWWDSMSIIDGQWAQTRRCADEPLDFVRGPTFDGLPTRCSLGSHTFVGMEDPFGDVTALNKLVPSAIVNRMDLAPSNFADCGEVRVIYAGGDPVFSGTRAIFEARVPNPTPGCATGCVALANWWRRLSTDRTRAQGRLTAAETRARLEALLFTGIPELGGRPVVHIDNYRGADHYTGSSGQIRINAAHNSNMWELHEFKLERSCATNPCTLRFVPTTVKSNPAGVLFYDPALLPPEYASQAASFQARFVHGSLTRGGAVLESSAVDELALRFTPFTPGLSVLSRFDAGASSLLISHTADVSLFGGNDYTVVAHGGFRAAIEARLATLRARPVQPLTAPLTADHILTRLEALSCAGCHSLTRDGDAGGGVALATSSGFSFVTDRVVVDGPIQRTVALAPSRPGHVVDRALVERHLPERRTRLVALLNGQACARCPSPSTRGSTSDRRSRSR